ncbi:MAG: hypothetical protein J0M28_13375 [Thauera sp.]|nr:hypothetical protein [Thauera sp.]
MPAERTVNVLKVRASGDAQARHARLLLEDALRTASLPGDGAALVLVRKLRLPAFSSGATSQSLACALEESCRALQVLPVTEATTERAIDAAAAVRFRDALQARQELGLRLLRGMSPRAWCWPLAVPGYRQGLTSGEALRAIAISFLDLPEAGLALPLWLDEIAAGGAIPRVIAALPRDDAEALLAVLTSATHRVPRLQPGRAHAIDGDLDGPASGQPEFAYAAIPARWQNALRWARQSLAPGDARLRLVEAAAQASVSSARVTTDARRQSAAGVEWRRCEGVERGLERREVPRKARRSPMPRGARVAEGEKPPSSSAPAALLSHPPSPALREGNAPDSRAEAQGRVERDAPYASGTEADRRQMDAPLRARPLRPAPPFSVAVQERTAAAGLLFLVPVLASLGLPAWLQANAAWAGADLPARVIGCALQRLRVSADDPAWLLAEDPTDQPRPVPAGEQFSALVDMGLRPAPGRSAAEAWLGACRRWLRLRARIGIASLVLRPGRMAVTPTHADVWMAIGQTDLRVRSAGLDLDLGWVPWVGRVVNFHYGDAET